MTAGWNRRRDVLRIIRARGSGKVNSDLLVVTALLVGWFALQAWVLPKMGVST